jgi:hypothetical protein
MPVVKVQGNRDGGGFGGGLDQFAKVHIACVFACGICDL